jgi:hypothetical protein
MALQVGSRVKLIEGGVSVFRIVEMEADGDPTHVVVEPVEDAPGGYPFPTPIQHLVLVDE